MDEAAVDDNATKTLHSSEQPEAVRRETDTGFGDIEHD